MNAEEKLVVVIVDDRIQTDTPYGRTLNRISKGLEEWNIDVIQINSFESARSVYAHLPLVNCILISWNLGNLPDQVATYELIHDIRSRNADIPIFLLGDPGNHPLVELTVDMIREINEFIYVMEDTPDFIAGRIRAAANRYRSQLLPPFFNALVNFSRDYEYSWHTPGHAGGTAFRKSPAGRIFHSFFGEQLFRSDLSVSVAETGSLLEHSGPVGEAERYAAKVFGADETYFVTNGTSTANKIVFFNQVSRNDVVLVDRNCHKSAEHALTMTHSIAVFMVPTRNRYGIIGPIPPDEMTPVSISQKINACPLTRDIENKTPVHAIITNSTYDGLCYHVTGVEDLLGASVDSIHFDEAWYGYARFNPLYCERYAMRGTEKDDTRPTVFATQSTHKLLAALSQASMIHIRNGRVPIEHSRFNEGFMMHTSTSPLYTIIASLDVASKMMDGPAGRALTSESIEEAIKFRQTMARIYTELSVNSEKDDWWFRMWQPETVILPEKSDPVDFALAPRDHLRNDPSCWVLHPGDSWHGFTALPDNYCMLDPIKVTVLMPGVNDDGSLDGFGIPAAVVVKFLDTRGIVNEKSGDYNILFLFSMGITKGKWGTLITELFEFKRHYDEATPLEEIFPDLTSKWPKRYGGMTLQSLTDEMHQFKRDQMSCELLQQAFSTLPEPVMSYAEAYRRLIKGDAEQVPIVMAGNRIVATGIFPYPPGIPILAPGERTGSQDGPVLQYLLSLQEFDRRFPGFEHETHGIEVINGEYMMYCVKEDRV